MSVPSSLTLNYDAILSTTLFNVNKMLHDQISTANALFFELKRTGGWKTTSDLGDRLQIPLMYALTSADAYSGYDVLDTTPTDGVTSAFFNWRQASVPIAISRLEERKNAGSEARILALLEAKIKQSLLGIQDFFGKAFLRGEGVNDTTSITSAYASASNGASFIDPLPLLVKYDPTTSTTIGNINQSTYSWWRNTGTNSGATSYAGFLKELSNMRNDCSKGPGGAPNFHLVDQNVFELYEAALWAKHQNNSHTDADYPFPNLRFHGSKAVWDEFVPDVAGGSTTQSTTSGTWFMLNLAFLGITFDSETNFINTPFVKPENQDAKVAHILALCASHVSNRRKQGVLGSIDTTITS